MPKKQSRIELLTSFFPELQKFTDRGDREKVVKLSAATVGAILADHIFQFDKGFKQYGKGVLLLQLHNKRADYLPIQLLEEDLEDSRIMGHTEVGDMYQKVVDKVESFNFNNGVLIVITDDTSMELFVLDRENPAASVQAMLEEFS